MIEPADPALTPTVASYLLGVRFSAADQARVSELIAKLKDDAISSDEREELENYNRINLLLGVMKSRARQVLRQRGE